MSVTKVTLAAGVYTSLEAAVDALGDKEGEIIIRHQLVDLEVGLVNSAHSTVTALPEVDQAGMAVRVLKPLESALQLYAQSAIGGTIEIERMGNPIISDSSGVSSS